MTKQEVVLQLSSTMYVNVMQQTKDYPSRKTTRKQEEDEKVRMLTKISVPSFTCELIFVRNVLILVIILIHAGKMHYTNSFLHCRSTVYNEVKVIECKGESNMFLFLFLRTTSITTGNYAYKLVIENLCIFHRGC